MDSSWLLATRSTNTSRVSSSIRRASSPLKARKSSSTLSDSLRSWRSSVPNLGEVYANATGGFIDQAEAET
uniref:Uncharacterized protein n=1 Tax=Zea mays TaxID=4577 RepID=C0HG85_MAIZE|nr:unknown [Zea mays]